MHQKNENYQQKKFLKRSISGIKNRDKTTQPTDMKKIITGYFKNPYANK